MEPIRLLPAAIMAAAAFLALWGPLSGKALAAADSGARTLVVYFSWSGNTKAVAEAIHSRVGGDLIRLETAEPYPSDYNAVLDQAKLERETGARPALKNVLPDLAGYDVVFLGYPNWWSSIPAPVAVLLEGRSFAGKTVAPFCSHGGGRLGRSVADLAELAPGAVLTEALAVHSDGGRRLGAEVDAWLARIGRP